MISKIPKKYKKICKDFAIKCYNTRPEYYHKQNKDPIKAVQDNYIGKLAEFAVWVYLKKSTPPPDLTILSVGHKKHGADLSPCHHVKSVLSDNIISWVYEKNDPNRFNGIHYFCVVDLKINEIEIKYIIKGEYLRKLYSELRNRNPHKVSIDEYDLKYSNLNFIYRI
jgi:hypothetical protein